MDVSITKMSQNGQVVIPAEIRKDAGIKPSTKFLVINEGKDILLKRIETESFMQDLQLLRDIAKSEEEFARGEYVEADSSMSFEEIDKLLME